MNWHAVLVLYTALLGGVVVAMVIFNPFFENIKLLLWTIPFAVLLLALLTLLVGGSL